MIALMPDDDHNYGYHNKTTMGNGDTIIFNIIKYIQP